MFVNVSFTHLGIVVALLAAIVAGLVSVWRSPLDVVRQVVWTILIVALPIVGAAAWFLTLAFERRARARA